MELVNPSIEQLVTEIIAVNHAWKEAKDLFEETASPLVNSLRDLKTRLQIQLLRNYAPEWVFLIEDTQAESDETLYGLQLVKAIGSWRDAAHLPVRVAQENLSSQELEVFIKS
ncbi:MAG: hypothetical protein QNJ34_00810 [Xenococcaceae cyanobacterium MO_188.B29]|nr:hypothetical protein [Xenococcaceae cyanobacterium MO_188.B29]